MPHNIVFFGETGVGKSSIINMLLGSEMAPVSNDAEERMATATDYRGRINGERYRFWDTRALSEGDSNTMPDIQAASSLYSHLCGLSESGGVSLLVFCMRGPRMTDAGNRNWRLFREIICSGQVPAVIAVTHLELVDMDEWWSRNEDAFVRYQMVPSRQLRRYTGRWEDHWHADKGAACITATKGRLRNGRYTYEEEYEASCRKIRKLVFESHLEIPWRVDAVTWFREVVVKIDRTFLLRWLGPLEKKERLSGQGVFKVMDMWGVSEEEAKEIATTLEEVTNPREVKESKESGFSCVIM